jgi:malonyl-CoA O-methyltransferase
MNPDPILDDQKQQIARQFGQAATAYNIHAKLQCQSAQHLLDLIQSYRNLIPPGDILEIGCGTGFITQGLVECFTNRTLEITDLSLRMLKFCQHNVIIPPEQVNHISFFQLDAEMELRDLNQYASIVSGFTAQWFRDTYQTISQLILQLQSGGILFLSFPGNKSFPEWRHICERLDLPFTANRLPDLDLLLAQLDDQVRVLHVETADVMTHHASAADFFRDLKAIGAGVSRQHLSVGQMKRLIQGWNTHTSGQIDVHHQIIYLALQRSSS